MEILVLFLFGIEFDGKISTFFYLVLNLTEKLVPFHLVLNLTEKVVLFWGEEVGKNGYFEPPHFEIGCGAPESRYH